MNENKVFLNCTVTEQLTQKILEDIGFKRIRKTKRFFIRIHFNLSLVYDLAECKCFVSQYDKTFNPDNGIWFGCYYHTVDDMLSLLDSISLIKREYIVFQEY